VTDSETKHVWPVLSEKKLPKKQGARHFHKILQSTLLVSSLIDELEKNPKSLAAQPASLCGREVWLAFEYLYLCKRNGTVVQCELSQFGNVPVEATVTEWLKELDPQ